MTFKKLKYPLPVFLKDPLQRKRKERGGEVGELLKSWSVKARLPSTDIISANGIELQRPENAVFRILQRIVIFYCYHIIGSPNPTKTFHNGDNHPSYRSFGNCLFDETEMENYQTSASMRLRGKDPLDGTVWTQQFPQ